MPYSQELERRLDQLAPQLGAFEKKKMFGGVGYMLNGNMVFGIHKDLLIIRTSPEQAEELLKRESVSLFDMTRKPMKGWLQISLDGVRTEKQLREMLDLAIDYVKGLPEK